MGCNLPDTYNPRKTCPGIEFELTFSPSFAHIQDFNEDRWKNLIDNSQTDTSVLFGTPQNNFRWYRMLHVIFSIPVQMPVLR